MWLPDPPQQEDLLRDKTWMKSCAAVVLVLAFVCAEAQTQWKHERLIDEILYPGQKTNSFINANGDVAFTTRSLDGHFDAWKYRSSTKTLLNLNQTYLGLVSNGTTLGINRYGQVAWEGGTVTSISVNADGHDFYAPLFPPDTNQSHVFIRGIDDAGDPFWFYQKSGVHRVFQGGTEISGGAAISDLMLYGTNGKGDTLYGATDSGGQINLYKNGVNFTAGLLGGDSQFAQTGIVGASGSVLWDGYGATTNGRFDLFLNNQNLTFGLFPSMKAAHVEAINSADQYLWIRVDTNNTDHMMLGMRDLTAEVSELGIDGIRQGLNFVNKKGDVFWNGASSTLGYLAILNGKNLTTEIVGIPTDFDMTGLDGFGNGVWYASGPKVPVRSVFVNQFNLSADAYGGFNYRAAAGLAVGVNGQVLWTAQDPDDTSSVWLSTPVPEPGLIVPAILILALIRRRRKWFIRPAIIFHHMHPPKT
jgi:hypothetical protein